ncbi:PAS domain-containing protein [Jannaschia sp. W003]|uniref:PAS domain-containing protein n=1 Tax=Jannaschia sp. W003 TaxID=2867012 RepID=UPI0021A2E1EC|nr:PAS domain-containing protein [Jannaschia sp. W003]UWQ20594.1 PAS domain-containing protein [Jannaschia sp. W003]
MGDFDYGGYGGAGSFGASRGPGAPGGDAAPASPILARAWALWSAMREDGALPLRTDLDPMAMRTILGHAVMLERVRPGTVRVRLGGRVANGVMGMELRGLPVRAFFETDQRARAVRLFERPFAESASLELDLISPGAEGPLAARMLVLPLCEASGRVCRALGVLVPDRVVVEGPRRFAILRDHVAPLLAPRPARRPVLAEAAEAQAPYRPGPPHLRVVK